MAQDWKRPARCGRGGRSTRDSQVAYGAHGMGTVHHRQNDRRRGRCVGHPCQAVQPDPIGTVAKPDDLSHDNPGAAGGRRGHWGHFAASRAGWPVSEDRRCPTWTEAVAYRHTIQRSDLDRDRPSRDPDGCTWARAPSEPYWNFERARAACLKSVDEGAAAMGARRNEGRRSYRCVRDLVMFPEDHNDACWPRSTIRHPIAGGRIQLSTNGGTYLERGGTAGLDTSRGVGAGHRSARPGG